MAKYLPIGDGKGPLERGRVYYYEKEYDSALVAFAEAVRTSTGHLLHNALDHHAAACEKLGDLQPALKDAKLMIDMNPELAKGYLRCGKVLQLKGQNQLALKIYERGLRKVKIGTDDDRVKLQSMFNKLWQLENKDKCLDPLVYLPNELALMVCEHLEMRDRVICLAVSKSWKRLLESSHRLWTTLDTTSARKAIGLKSLAVHFRRSNFAIDRATITFRAAFDTQKWQYMFRVNKYLKELTIHGAGVIGYALSEYVDLAVSLAKITIGTNCLVTPRAIMHILTSCRKTLVEATFLKIAEGIIFPRPLLEPCDSLKLLRLRGEKRCFISADILCLSIPNIKSLLLEACVIRVMETPMSDFTSLSTLKHLEDLIVQDAQLSKTIINLPLTLKHLDISKNHLIEQISTNPQVPQTTILPNLTWLDCSGTALTGQSIVALTTASVNAGNLKTLRLGHRYLERETGLITDTYPQSDILEELSLAGMPLHDPRITDIVSLYPNLKMLDLNNTKVTGVGVKFCVERGIIRLGLSGCYGVSSDAVDWARARGVEVHHEFRDAA